MASSDGSTCTACLETCGTYGTVSWTGSTSSSGSESCSYTCTCDANVGAMLVEYTGFYDGFTHYVCQRGTSTTLYDADNGDQVTCSDDERMVANSYGNLGRGTPEECAEACLDHDCNAQDPETPCCTHSAWLEQTTACTGYSSCDELRTVWGPNKLWTLFENVAAVPIVVSCAPGTAAEPGSSTCTACNTYCETGTATFTASADSEDSNISCDYTCTTRRRRAIVAPTDEALSSHLLNREPYWATGGKGDGMNTLFVYGELGQSCHEVCMNTHNDGSPMYCNSEAFQYPKFDQLAAMEGHDGSCTDTKPHSSELAPFVTAWKGGVGACLQAEYPKNHNCHGKSETTHRLCGCVAYDDKAGKAYTQNTAITPLLKSTHEGFYAVPSNTQTCTQFCSKMDLTCDVTRLQSVKGVYDMAMLENVMSNTIPDGCTTWDDSKASTLNPRYRSDTGTCYVNPLETKSTAACGGVLQEAGYRFCPCYRSLQAHG